MARGGRIGNKGGGRPMGSKNKSTGEFQAKYRAMMQSIVELPAYQKFYRDVVNDVPMERQSYEVKDPKTGTYIRKVRLVRLDPKTRAEIMRDVRDGAGCRPMLLVEGNSSPDSEKDKDGGKPSFNISISVV